MPDTKSYLIRRASGPVRLACDDPLWRQAETLSIDQFPWYQAGQRQDTTAALLYDDAAVYALFVCEDRHIGSEETRPNGNVYKDSCVEFFAMPDPRPDGGYFNFEANCCGVVHLGFGPGRPDRRLAGPPVHKQLRVTSSIPGPTKQQRPTDDGWWLAARLPFAAVSDLAGLPVAPGPGSVWRGNFYRCGGTTDPQYGCWNPIVWERPDFHRPEFFGTLAFE